MHVIVASSNVFRRELTSYLLSEAGYIVHEARDGAALQACLQSVQPVLLLLDGWLVGSESVDLDRLLQQIRPTPVLAMVSDSAVRGTGRWLQLYSDDLLHWPYQPEELMERVHQVTTRSGLPSLTTHTLRLGEASSVVS